ncbi:helix-turn-helix transcriptional regulator [Pseudoxanthomonas mexicana]
MSESSTLPSRDQWMRAVEVLAALPICKATFYKGIKRGVYPAPTKFGKLSRWRKADIQRLVEHGTADKAVAA